jgi:hypothetical protein
LPGVRIITTWIQPEMLQSDWDKERMNTTWWWGFDQDEGIVLREISSR